jgi:DNA-binding transcriptional ArsR family regulator
MKQLDIFKDICAANHGGNENSIEAHNGIIPAKLKLHRGIMAAIKLRGNSGMTVDELEIALSLPHQTASARMSELKSAGLIVQVGKRKTRTGSNAGVWILSRQGEEALKR